jgi:hypothetical protein
VSIAWDTKTKVYGQANPTFTTTLFHEQAPQILDGT